MSKIPTGFSPPINHVFVDFENVHEVDLAVIGSKAVSFTLLVGSRQTKLDVSLVEKLFQHAASVQLVRLASGGRNALDFILTYYLGRAVAADPTGCFHIISKDTGFDPLVLHLRSKHIDAHRHDNFVSFINEIPAKPHIPIPPIVTPRQKPSSKAKAKSSILEMRAAQVLEHWRKPSATYPKNQKKLISYLVAHLGHKITETEAAELVKYLSQAGHLVIDEKEVVTYPLKPSSD